MEYYNRPHWQLLDLLHGVQIVRRRLTEDAQKWDENLSDDLKAALKVIHHTFGEAHWKCAQITETFCYAALHDFVLEDLHEWAPPLNHLKLIVGGAATQRFVSHLATGTPSATVAAFFDLYLDGVATDLAKRHADLVAIAAANEHRLGAPQNDWIEFQAKQLIRSQSYMIPIWTRNICDKQPYDRSDDTEESIFWRSGKLLRSSL